MARADEVVCPVCGRARMLRLRRVLGKRTGRRLGLYGCWWCGSLANPSGYRETEDQLRQDVDYYVDRLAESSRVAQALVSYLRDRYPTADTLLDIGASIGLMVAEAQRVGMQAVGVEPNPYAVAWAREKLGVELVCSPMRQDFAQRPFDIVLLNQVLEHLASPSTLLRLACEATRPGGALFVSVPFRARTLAKAALFVLFPSLRGSPYDDNDVHVVHFSHRGFKIMASALGLEVREFVSAGYGGYVLHRPRPPEAPASGNEEHA